MAYKFQWQIYAFVGILFLLTGCNTPAYISFHPENIGDGWETAPLKSQIIRHNEYYKQLEEALNNNKYKNIHSILVVKNKKLVFESYFHGYNKENPHDLRSSTKSILSLLVGIADQRNYLDTENPIKKYLLEYSHSIKWSEQKKRITVDHLLNMTSGLDSDDWKKDSPGNELKMYNKHDWSHFILKQNVTAEPGKVFRYSTGGTILLGRVLSNALNVSIPEFSKQVLFEDLNITNFKWQKTPDNKTDTGGHLYLKPRDMAKIGQLVLNNGKWKNKQIVSEAWIKKSTTPTTTIPEKESLDLSYGYLWWHHTFKVDTQPVRSIIAWGNGGQFIFIFPQLDMVVVFTGGNYNSLLTLQPFEILETYILN